MAVIGTGASPIQIVPEIAGQVAHLDVYQRTAPWVIPRHDRAYTALEKLALHGTSPASSGLPHGDLLGPGDVRAGVHGEPEARRAGQARLALLNIEQGITDPELREKVTPDYQIGCKRILISNDWYPALDRDNVDLVTDGIEQGHPRGIVTADGVEREVDVIIVATGFHTTDLPIARAHHRPRRRQRWPSTSPSTACRPTRAPPCTASRTCSSSSARTPASATRAWCS